MTDTGAPRPVVVALVPAKDRVDRIADTVAALRRLGSVDEVLVVDDGSRDATAEVAAEAGAQVLRLPRNRGKGGAVLAGVEATPDADVYLLIDADLAETAGSADALLDPVLTDEADLVVGVFPPAAGRGGSGRVKAVAGAAIRRATGRDVREPLSGQRAVRRGLLAELPSADRFGLEVAMTIDALRADARLVEVEVPMDHRHTGGSLSGYVHRARQGVDILRAAWSRLTTPRQRLIAIAAVFVVLVGVGLWSSSRAEPSSTALGDRPSKVVVLAMNPMGFGDLDRDDTPNLRRAVDEGALAAMSVRTAGRRPTLAEGYTSLGAGFRLRALPSATEAYPAGEDIGAATAAEVLESRTGVTVDGEVAVVGAPATFDLNDRSTVDSGPGALGEALADSGRIAAVVGNGDRPAVGETTGVINRPAALAVMGADAAVPVGTIGADALLERDPLAPFGVRADADATLAAVDAAAEEADVVFVDPGDLDRADMFRGVASIDAQNEARDAALRSTDEILGRLLDWADDDTTIMVVSVASPGRTFRLTPLVVVGPGVPQGYVVSPSTKRVGLVALTDIAPTILDMLGEDVPSTMPGRPVRYQAGEVDRVVLAELDDGTLLRERTYYSLAVWYIVFQAVTCLLAAFIISRRGARRPRGTPLLRGMVLAAAALPLATFLFVLVPGWSGLEPPGAYAATIAITVAVTLLASRARRTPLSPLTWILGATLAVVAIDAATGTWLHVNSWLGYSLHSAGRFYGIPNTTFAVLAACGILLACIHVRYAPRPNEALFTSTLLLAGLVIVDGAPTMGGDVGGIVTLVPIFGLLLFTLSGRRLTGRTVAIVGAATALALAAATAVDLARPAESRTHLGRFAADLFDNGFSELTTTFLRKQDANFRILQASVWTWMIPIVAFFLLYVLAYERQWSSLLPRGSAVRAGVVAVIAGSLLGFLANDSGPIVIALFFAYLAPFVTLIALDEKWGRPVLLAARGPTSDDPGGAVAPEVSTTAPVGGAR